MNYKHILNNIADKIENIIIQYGGKEIPTQDYGWSNKRFVSDKFRLSHIERYSDKNLEVLHITCFPTEKYQHPIFGFDIICTEKKPLAAFMDWSPVDNETTIHSKYKYETEYPLPDWAKDIFSPTALAIIPTDSELDSLVNNVIESFQIYLHMLDNSTEALDRVDYIIAAQNRYCENQQKNERTLNVLKAKLGFEDAIYFMQNVLFPKINN